MSNIKKYKSSEKREGAPNPITMTPASQQPSLFQLEQPNLATRNSLSGSQLGASRYRILLDTCFKLSFRTFFETGKNLLEIKYTPEVIKNALHVVELLKGFLNRSTKQSHTSFIYHKTMHLEFDSLTDIVEDHWLKDDAVAGILDSLNMTQWHNESISNEASRYCFSSLVFKKLFDEISSFKHENEEKFASSFNERIKNGSLKSFVYNIIQDHPNINRIHFVVNLSNIHFTSLSSDFTSKSVTSIDPMNGIDSMSLQRSVISKIIGVFYHIIYNSNNEKIFLGKKDMHQPTYDAENINHSMPSFSHKSVTNHNLPVQKDNFNCGVLSLYYIMADFFKIPINVLGKFDPTSFRYQMFLYYFLVKIFLESYEIISPESLTPSIFDENNTNETINIINFFEICKKYKHPSSEIQNKVLSIINTYYDDLANEVKSPKLDLGSADPFSQNKMKAHYTLDASARSSNTKHSETQSDSSSVSSSESNDKSNNAKLDFDDAGKIGENKMKVDNTGDTASRIRKRKFSESISDTSTDSIQSSASKASKLEDHKMGDANIEESQHGPRQKDNSETTSLFHGNHGHDDDDNTSIETTHDENRGKDYPTIKDDQQSPKPKDIINTALLHNDNYDDDDDHSNDNSDKVRGEENENARKDDFPKKTNVSSVNSSPDKVQKKLKRVKRLMTSYLTHLITNL